MPNAPAKLRALSEKEASRQLQPVVRQHSYYDDRRVRHIRQLKSISFDTDATTITAFKLEFWCKHLMVLHLLSVGRSMRNIEPRRHNCRARRGFQLHPKKVEDFAHAKICVPGDRFRPVVRHQDQ